MLVVAQQRIEKVDQRLCGEPGFGARLVRRDRCGAVTGSVKERREIGLCIGKREHRRASRGDRKSTRLNPVTNAHLVCRLLLEKKTKKSREQRRHHTTRR